MANIESAATFLISSILLSLGLLTFVVVAVVVNNIITKFWKPVKLVSYHVNNEKPQQAIKVPVKPF